MRKESVIGAVVVMGVATAGYFGALAPQNATAADLDTQIAALRTSTTATAAKLPQLKGELATISGQVEALRGLSAQVPPQINVPELYEELAAAAQTAGLPGGAEGVSVTAPTLVAPAAAAAAPAAAATTASATKATDEATTAPAATPAAKQAGSTIASFEVTLTVHGTVGQTVAFLTALRQSARLSIVSSSSLTVDASGKASLQVRATYYLQQVDVAGLVSQIEALTNAAADPDAKVAVDATSTGAAPASSATPAATGTTAPDATSGAVPSSTPTNG